MWRQTLFNPAEVEKRPNLPVALIGTRLRRLHFPNDTIFAKLFERKTFRKT